MKEVKVQKKYKCDFCKRRSVKAAMKKHEPRCFRNPNRYCDHCENKGFTHEHLVGDGVTEPAYYQDVPCPYCSKHDPKIEEAIRQYEKSLAPEVAATSPSEGVPF